MTVFLRDTRLLFGRNMRNTLRNPVWMMMGLFQPVLYLLLFAPLLNSLSLPGFGRSNALTVFAPGLLIMMAMFGTGYAGFVVIDDLRNGVVERFRVTPASRVALLLGMVLRDVLILLAQSALLLVVAALMGLYADLPGVLLLIALMVLIGTMMASISYALGLIFKDEGALSATLSAVLLPLQLLSGVLLPLTLVPKILQLMAALNPFAHAVDAARALVNGNLTDSAVLLGFGFVGVFAVLAVAWASRVFRQATA